MDAQRLYPGAKLFCFPALPEPDGFTETSSWVPADLKQSSLRPSLASLYLEKVNSGDAYGISVAPSSAPQWNSGPCHCCEQPWALWLHQRTSCSMHVTLGKWEGADRCSRAGPALQSECPDLLWDQGSSHPDASPSGEVTVPGPGLPGGRSSGFPALNGHGKITGRKNHLLLA